MERKDVEVHHVVRRRPCLSTNRPNFRAVFRAHSKVMCRPVVSMYSRKAAINSSNPPYRSFAGSSADRSKTDLRQTARPLEKSMLGDAAGGENRDFFWRAPSNAQFGRQAPGPLQPMLRQIHPAVLPFSAEQGPICPRDGRYYNKCSQTSCLHRWPVRESWSREKSNRGSLGREKDRISQRRNDDCRDRRTRG